MSLLPTAKTRGIQYAIRDLGKQLGFLVETENTGSHGNRAINNDEHTPIFDVVWYLDLEKTYNLEPLRELLKNDPVRFNKISKLPIAGFEVEGSGTSSKNQLGNITNLYYGDFIYKFIVVNNAEAKGKKLEEDTYRRGIRIARYFQQMQGSKNLFVADWTHFKNSIDKYAVWSSKSNPKDLRASINKSLGSGGETVSHDTREQMMEMLSTTGLTVVGDYRPQNASYEYELSSKLFGNTLFNDERDFLLRRRFYRLPYDNTPSCTSNICDIYYIPKLDIACGIPFPFKLAQWMKILGSELREDIVNYPLLYWLNNVDRPNFKKHFIPIISVEIEASNNKHLMGGCVNMEANSLIGILAAPKECEKRYRYIVEKCGLRNVIFHEIVI